MNSNKSKYELFLWIYISKKIFEQAFFNNLNAKKNISFFIKNMTKKSLKERKKAIKARKTSRRRLVPVDQS